MPIYRSTILMRARREQVERKRRGELYERPLSETLAIYEAMTQRPGATHKKFNERGDIVRRALGISALALAEWQDEAARESQEEAEYERLRSARRRRQILKATPWWADRRKIKAFYDRARRKTESTGIQHVVDHIIPIFGNGVSGLHVPANLQIITLQENSSKGNKVLDESEFGT